MSHSNSAQNSTEVNLDAATLDSYSGEEQNMPSRSSSLIPEYENLRTSGLSLSKIIQDKYKMIKGIPKVLSLISLFTSVAMSITKSILP